MSATSSTAKRIGTHDGTFHADEALACYLLSQTDAYADASIVRTRDSTALAAMDVVVDVGGVYDPASHRYDHHQREFRDTFDAQHSIRLSSAGLVYRHFGDQVLRRLTGIDSASTLQKAFVMSLDAVDNGVSMYESPGEPRFADPTTLAARVALLNPAWNDDRPQPDAQFAKAVALVGAEFAAFVKHTAAVWLPAREIVEQALATRTQTHASGRIVELARFCPWTDHLFELERALGVEGATLYCVFADTSGLWRVRAVPKFADSFESRRPLPEPWCGLRDAMLEQACGVAGASFVHANGFIGGHRTREGALLMAERALAFAL